MTSITVFGRGLTAADTAVVLSGEPFRAELADDARERIVASRAVVTKLVGEGRTIYGVNTGFGKLADQRIPPDKVRELQRNLLLSHACGVGEPLDDDIVALALLFRANALPSRSSA